MSPIRQGRSPRRPAAVRHPDQWCSRVRTGPRGRHGTNSIDRCVDAGGVHMRRSTALVAGSAASAPMTAMPSSGPSGSRSPSLRSNTTACAAISQARRWWASRSTAPESGMAAAASRALTASRSRGPRRPAGRRPPACHRPPRRRPSRRRVRHRTASSGRVRRRRHSPGRRPHPSLTTRPSKPQSSRRIVVSGSRFSNA